MAGRVRVFCACSLDGFLAGENDDLSWLPQPDPNAEREGEDSFTSFMNDVGCILMGRNTYRIPAEWAGPWPYGEMPVRVVTHRPLAPKVPSVRAIEGDIRTLVKEGLEAAHGKDLYIDGGQIIRQCLDAKLVDQMNLTFVPTILGKGISLFAGTERRHEFTVTGSKHTPQGLLEVILEPRG